MDYGIVDLGSVKLGSIKGNKWDKLGDWVLRGLPN